MGRGEGSLFSRFDVKSVGNVNTKSWYILSSPNSGNIIPSASHLVLELLVEQ